MTTTNPSRGLLGLVDFNSVFPSHSVRSVNRCSDQSNSSSSIKHSNRRLNNCSKVRSLSSSQLRQSTVLHPLQKHPCCVHRIKRSNVLLYSTLLFISISLASCQIHSEESYVRVNSKSQSTTTATSPSLSTVALLRTNDFQLDEQNKKQNSITNRRWTAEVGAIRNSRNSPQKFTTTTSKTDKLGEQKLLKHHKPHWRSHSEEGAMSNSAQSSLLAIPDTVIQSLPSLHSRVLSKASSDPSIGGTFRDIENSHSHHRSSKRKRSRSTTHGHPYPPYESPSDHYDDDCDDCPLMEARISANSSNSSSSSSSTVLVPKNVTSQVGHPAYLHCVVESIGDKMVSWIRLRDFHLLTIGSLTYIQDDRFIVRPTTHPVNDWPLQIKHVTLKDEGLYECQINSDPPRSQYYYLHVVVPVSEIVGNPDIFVRSRAPINLTCIISSSPEPPAFVFWYHNNRMINYDYDSAPNVESSGTGDSSAQGSVGSVGQISVQKDPNKADVIISKLLIKNARVEDNGNYTCSPSNAEPASVYVHVLQGEKRMSNEQIQNDWNDDDQVNNEGHHSTALPRATIKTKLLLAAVVVGQQFQLSKNSLFTILFAIFLIFYSTILS